jgi:predicted RNase H-like HicB family nuclease
MRRLTVEIIPDTEHGGYTARVPDIPAYGEGDIEEEAIKDLREALLASVLGALLEETTTARFGGTVKAWHNEPASKPSAT